MDSKQTPTNKQHLSVPPGWKLVPIEPTVPMVVLAAENLCCEFDPHTVGPQAKFMLAVYREFLAAAPQFEAPNATELLADAAATLDVLISKVPIDSPLQIEARAGAKELVEKLYAMAEVLS